MYVLDSRSYCDSFSQITPLPFPFLSSLYPSMWDNIGKNLFLIRGFWKKNEKGNNSVINQNPRRVMRWMMLDSFTHTQYLASLAIDFWWKYLSGSMS